MNKRRRKYKREKASRSELLQILVIGIIMGTVFIFGQGYFQKPIEYEETIQTEATYVDYKERVKRGNIVEIILYFSDYEQLSIDRTCINEELRNDLKLLEKNSKVDLKIHPNSSMIVELVANGREMLNFQDVQNNLAQDNKEFFGLGIICYIAAIYALGQILFCEKRS